jgi:hypothetical protein
MAKHHTHVVERRTAALSKRSLISEDIAKLLRPHRFKATQVYELPKIVHKYEVPPRAIVSTIGAPNYILIEFLAVVLVFRLGKYLHHVKNSEDHIRKLDSGDVQGWSEFL